VQFGTISTRWRQYLLRSKNVTCLSGKRAMANFSPFVPNRAILSNFATTDDHCIVTSSHHRLSSEVCCEKDDDQSFFFLTTIKVCRGEDDLVKEIKK
jgi:hypothetical protein